MELYIFNAECCHKYKDVFDRLAARDTQYKTLPSEIEWMKAKEICERLEVFYDVTNLFSGTEYPTANVYFPKVCEMKLALVWLNGLPLMIMSLNK